MKSIKPTSRYAKLNKCFSKLRNNGLELKHLPYFIRDSKKFVIIAIKSNPWALLYASEELKDDEYIVRQAIKKDGRILQYASPRIRKKIKFIKTAYSKTWPSYFE